MTLEGPSRKLPNSMLVLAVAVTLALPCWAQVPASTTIPDLTPPQYSARDENGVEILSGIPDIKIPIINIGTEQSRFSLTIDLSKGVFFPELAFADSFLSWIAFNGAGISSHCTNPGYATTTYGGVREDFCLVSGNYVSVNQQGSSLALISGTSNRYLWTMSNGTQITFDGGFGQYMGASSSSSGATQVVEPNGRLTQIWLKSVQTAVSSGGPVVTLSRIQSVTRSDGLQIKYDYQLNSQPSYSNLTQWNRPSSVVALNNAYEYCAPTSDSCSFSKTWPTGYLTDSNPSLSAFPVVKSFTDERGGVTRITGSVNASGDFVVSIKPPTSASTDTITYVMCSPFTSPICRWSAVSPAVVPPASSLVTGYAYSSTRDGETWNYDVQWVPWSQNGLQAGLYRSSNSKGTFFRAEVSPNGTIALMNMPDGRFVQFGGPGWLDLVSQVTYPEGNGKSYFYDGRGNLTLVQAFPKTGSTQLAYTVASAGFDTTCANIVKCNKPSWVKDALSNVTDYVYDPVHGGVLSVTSPADSNGVRPQKRYSYAQRYAWYLNSSGSYAKGPAPIWLLTQESFCRTSSANAPVPPALVGSGCASASDEVVTAYDYGPDSGPNNLFLRGVAVTADGVTRRTCYSYDIYGNRISETTANAGLASCP